MAGLQLLAVVQLPLPAIQWIVAMHPSPGQGTVGFSDLVFIPPSKAESLVARRQSSVDSVHERFRIA